MADYYVFVLVRTIYKIVSEELDQSKGHLDCIGRANLPRPEMKYMDGRKRGTVPLFRFYDTGNRKNTESATRPIRDGGISVRLWYKEDWQFQITVLSLEPDNKPTRCRNGHEVGDQYNCTYGCPGEFCSKSMLKAFPIMEAARSGGDLRNLGALNPT